MVALLQSDGVNITLTGFYTILGICSILLGVATVYLRLYLGSALTKTKDEIIQGVEMKFVNKEVVELKLGTLAEKVRRLERKMENGKPDE